MGIVGVVLVVGVAFLFLVLPPLLKKWRSGRPQFTSELSYLVGEKGWVVSGIAVDRTGMVRVGTDIWSARAEAGSQPIEPGQWVDIAAAQKNLLIVHVRPV